MPDLATTSVVINDGKVVLSKRARSPLWQCRFRIGRKWVRTSTKTAVLKEAKAVADDLYREAKWKEKHNLPNVSRKFSSVAEAVKAKLEQQAGAINKAYILSLTNHLVPFFGNHNVANISPQHIRQFYEWRRTKMGKEPSRTTVKTHNAAIRLVFDEAVTHGYMSIAQIPNLKTSKADLGKKGERRPDISLDEYRQLYRFMRKWVTQTRDGKPTAMRELLRDYVLILANSGIRHGTEAESMQWNRIQEHQDGNERGLSAWVKGKTEAGWAVLRPTCRRYLDRIRARTLPGLTWEECLQQDKPVFTLPNGDVTHSLHQTFEKLLTDANLLTDPKTKQKRTLYSLRHFYITQALLANRASPMVIAKQCRTSLLMIEKHYMHLEVMQQWKALSK